MYKNTFPQGPESTTVSQASRKTSKETSKEASKEPAKETKTAAVKTVSPAEGARDLVIVLAPLATRNRRPEPASATPPKRAGIDVSAVITRALTAAGLMK